MPVLNGIAARTGQKTPEGFYNIERMLERVLAGKGRVLLCGRVWKPVGSPKTSS